MSNALSTLALFELMDINAVNKRRREVSDYYFHNFNYKILPGFDGEKIYPLRFPVLVKDKMKAISFFSKHGIYIGDWYNQVIDPKSVKLEGVGYKMGSCPKAEGIAKHIINLPTYFSMTEYDVKKITNLMNEYAGN